jgi:hypothetical protein
MDELSGANQRSQAVFIRVFLVLHLLCAVTSLVNLSNLSIWGIIASGNGIRKDSFGDAIGEGA